MDTESQQSDGDRSKEHINWDEEYFKSIVGTRPSAKYGAVSESLRHAIPQETACSLFCGGKKCKYDSAGYWKPDQMELDGIFSNWVTDNIIAIARPTQEAIETHDLIGQFQKHGIKSIINLQTPGEHASCGNPLHESGFSYNPQEFMDRDVFFYNFGWPDYDVGSLANILDMVKVMQFAVSEGKVAVHCHAGLGRTGVMIGCYLVYVNRMDPGEAVHYIRLKRKGAVQTRNQVLCIEEFSQYLRPLRIVFSDVATDTYDFNLTQFLTRQKHVLHGNEARALKFVPKIVDVVGVRLLQLASKQPFHGERRDSKAMVMAMASAAFNNRPGSVIHNSPSTLSVDNAYNGVTKRSHSMENLNVKNSLNVSLKDGRPATLTPNPGRSQRMRQPRKDSDSDSSDEKWMDSKMRGSKSKKNSRLRTTSEMNGSHRASGGSLRRSISDEDCSPQCLRVLDALVQTEYSLETTQVVIKYKQALNEDSSTWTDLKEERDPKVLSKLLYDWLDHLKEPVLSPQDVPQMLNHIEEPMVGLARLSKGARFTTEYLFMVLVNLRPMPEDIEMDLIQRLLSTLTHQNMVVENTDVTMSTQSTASRRTMNTGEMNNTMMLRMMQFFLRLMDLLKERQHQQEEEESRRAEQEEEDDMYSKRRSRRKSDEVDDDYSDKRHRKKQSDETNKYSDERKKYSDDRRRYSDERTKHSDQRRKYSDDRTKYSDDDGGTYSEDEDDDKYSKGRLKKERDKKRR